MGLEDFIESVDAGEFDGHLGTLFEIVFERARATEVDFGWRIKLTETDVWDVQSVTLQELAMTEKACSTRTQTVSYLELDPIKRMDHLLALIIAHLHVIGGLRVEEATREVKKLTVTDLADIVSVYEVKAAPKADAGVTSNNS